MAQGESTSSRRRLTLRGLPLTIRWLFSCFLVTIGLGYLFALVYLFLIDVEAQRKAGLGLVQGTIIKYYGNRGDTRMEAALNGAMADMVDPAEKAGVIGWIRNGATEAGYDAIRPLFEKKCVSCHSPGSGYSVPPLTSYEEVHRLAEPDLGESFRALSRVSHIHLFGMSFIFMFTGMIFALTEIHQYLRLVIIGLPFLAVWMDIGSWWFTKYQPIFAYTVIIGGALMGTALAAQILISLWEMWLKKGGNAHGTE
ncbi:MAG TPA: hypothetical protein VLY20_06770 [Nitrospiria bacterium]|nr:hypothetical protein [Nitrospiria bacterium]